MVQESDFDEEQVGKCFKQGPMNDEALCLYQGMLNRHFHPKSVFIFDLELSQRVRETIGVSASPRAKQLLMEEIHEQTDRTLLTSYRWLVLSFERGENEGYEFVEVDLGEHTMKGKSE